MLFTSAKSSFAFAYAQGPERKSAVIEAKNRELVAYHEGGHALVALYTPNALPIHKATIIPRGQALGMVCILVIYNGMYIGWSNHNTCESGGLIVNAVDSEQASRAGTRFRFIVFFCKTL